MMLGRGLPNLGNTCYLNSILQCLRYTKEFVYPMKGKRASSALCISLLDLMYSGAEEKVLHTLIKELSKGREFKLMRQCDAHELFLYLVDKVFEEMKVHNPFEGKLESKVVCTVCGNNSVTSYPYVTISVQMGEKAMSVKSLVDEFCKTETIETPIECEVCNTRTKSSKSLRIIPSEVLVIHLKRFVGRQKNYTAVILDEELSLGKERYRLYAMCNHSGVPTAGHYTASCMKRDGTWSMCNDAFVQSIGSLPKSTDRPYILFYCKI